MKRLMLLAGLVALTGCGDTTGPEGPGDPLGENEILVRGTLEAASRVISLPISLSIPTTNDALGLDNVVVSTSSGDNGGYELRAEVDAMHCAGDFVILVYDAQDRWVGKRVRGCGAHTAHFNVGVYPG